MHNHQKVTMTDYRMFSTADKIEGMCNHSVANKTLKANEDSHNCCIAVIAVNSLVL
jgi:hypothetical protein